MNLLNFFPLRHSGDHLYLAIIFILLAFLSITPLVSAVADSSELMNLISANEDPFININDLAFFLATHNFDAVPKKDYVQVRLNSTIYRLVPNGQYPGLANVTFES